MTSPILFGSVSLSPGIRVSITSSCFQVSPIMTLSRLLGVATIFSRLGWAPPSFRGHGRRRRATLPEAVLNGDARFEDVC